MDEKKKSSVIKDISKQAWDDIIVPKTLESTNNMATDIVYMIADAFVQIIGRFIFRDKYVPTQRSGGGRDRYSNISRNKSQPQQNVATRSSDDLQYVCVDSYQKAEEIKRDLIDSITRYGHVRVADLYEKSGKVKTAFPDYNYGWTDINDVHFVRDRNGYWFNMPKPVQLNK